MPKKLRVTFEIDCSIYENQGPVTARQFAIDAAWQLFFHDATLRVHEKLLRMHGRDRAKLEPVVFSAMEELYERQLATIKEAEESAKYEWMGE